MHILSALVYRYGNGRLRLHFSHRSEASHRGLLSDYYLILSKTEIDLLFRTGLNPAHHYTEGVILRPIAVQV